ncbi:MAG: glutamyl-tRNA reductase [Erysipelotrichaceae bacterium]|nr:glutamyl-tRNA reductase [Erysipelotrichaceae bacterium]
MKFVVCGMDHTVCDMDTRKAFYFRDSDKLAFSVQLQVPCLLLSTCNRSEVCCILDDDKEGSWVKNQILDYFHSEDPGLYVYEQEDALRHILQVSCGIHSLVIGEDQILHQIKESLDFTLHHQFGCKELYHIFQRVLSFGKNMRSTYALSSHPLSVSYIAYMYLKKHLKDDSVIMVCGFGEMSQLMLKYLEGYRIVLVNRTYEKVQTALNDKVTYVSFDDRYAALEACDILVSATGSPHCIFTKEKLSLLKPLVCVDLAMPRDIESSVEELEGVSLVAMDQLQDVAKQELSVRKELVTKIEEESERATQEIFHELRSMKGDNLKKQIRQRYDEIYQNTYDTLVSKLTLDAREEHILRKVLHTTFVRMATASVCAVSEEVMEDENQVDLVLQLTGIKGNEK